MGHLRTLSSMALFHLPLPSPLFSPIVKETTAGKFSDHHILCRSLSFQKPIRKNISIASLNEESTMRGKVQSRTEKPVVRRFANYHPSIWKDEFIQSLNSKFKDVTYRRQLNQLKEEVKVLLNERTKDCLEQLELIDTLQRLGISYHFEIEIKDILERVYKSYEDDNWKKKNLYETSLGFRLLRQHRFNISQDVLNDFNNGIGNFNVCSRENAYGMLSLYEASFLLLEGENAFEGGKYFMIDYLEKYMRSSKDELDVAIIKHSLELPLYWRVPRLEARWFIDIYERKADMNHIILEIAKLDFNIVQSIHQEDLIYTSSWWRNIGLGEKLTFARDRLMLNFLWTIGLEFKPGFKILRRMLTKAIALIATIDDIYDVYGTLDELELFTNVIERWDVAAIDQLPYYMKACFSALHNFLDEMTFEVVRDQKVDVSQYLKSVWTNLCKSYLQEARWYYGNYKPTLEEYLDNAWISAGGSVISAHAYVFVTSQIKIEEMKSLTENVDIIRWTSIIVRLVDDLETSSDELKRGDVLKSIQCYMNDTGVVEDDAREYIRHLIGETWKKLNKAVVENFVFSQEFIEIVKNFVRMSQCVYQHGDGYGVEHEETKDRVHSLLIEPISIHY